MWVSKLLLSPGIIRIVCPKKKQIWPEIGIFGHLGQALPAHLVPYWRVGWWLWRAGCISHDTYLLYIIKDMQLTNFEALCIFSDNVMCHFIVIRRGACQVFGICPLIPTYKSGFKGRYQRHWQGKRSKYHDQRRLKILLQFDPLECVFFFSRST